MKLDNAIGFIVNSTGRNLMLLLNQRLIEYGVTSEQWTVLKRLEEQDGINIKKLAERVGKDQANVTRICDLLCKKELILKQANVLDKRSVLMYLTDEGKKIVDLLIPIDEKLQVGLLKDITEEDFLVFKKVIAQIDENINDAKEFNS